jgi:nitroimidazol reductase NimA-like FMN-containing flavoprotein (pyridoxamine 5'-phosphate oxidase superfamily)
MGTSRFEVPQWECLELLGAETVGRLCVVEHDYPLAFPVNYRVVCTDDATRLVFRTAPRAAVGRYEGPASLEIDQIDSTRQNAWSVIVRGMLHSIRHDEELPDTRPFVSDGRHQWMSLDVSAISGRRFTSAASNDGFSVEWQPAGGG